MSNPVDQIHEDHVNAAKVLDLIEQEVEHARNEQMPDLELLEDAMRYMVNYSDLIHHPKEDAMFARLIRTVPEAADRVEALRQEHLTLASLSSAFLDIIKAAESGEFVLRDEVIRRGSEYVETLRAHINTEESDLLKLAKQYLTDQDLEEINSEYASSRDPLMEDSLQQQYAAIYRSLFS